MGISLKLLRIAIHLRSLTITAQITLNNCLTSSMSQSYNISRFHFHNHVSTVSPLVASSAVSGIPHFIFSLKPWKALTGIRGILHGPHHSMYEEWLMLISFLVCGHAMDYFCHFLCDLTKVSAC